MDDTQLLLIGTLITLILGLIGGGILKKFRSFLKNISEFFTAIDNCLDKDCTPEEIRTIVKEGQETVSDGLGIILYLKGLIGK